jgi:drug/metabolite transporter (DMT)-like permease
VISARALGVCALLVTALGWGLGWVAMKAILQTWPPFFARGLAGVIAAGLLIFVAHCRREKVVLPRHLLPRVTLAAFTNVFAWMGFSALCLKWLPVSEGVLLVFTMPIWATLFARLFIGNRPSLAGLLALVLGIAGIAVLLGGAGLSFSAGKLLGIAFALSAAIFFALGAVLARRESPTAQQITYAAWQIALGCLPMLVIGVVVEQPDLLALDALGLAAMSYMTLLPMGLCYLTWFEALRRLPAAAASTSMLLVPLTGIFSASLLLAEPLGSRMLLAMALTLAGVILALMSS